MCTLKVYNVNSRWIQTCQCQCDFRPPSDLLVRSGWAGGNKPSSPADSRVRTEKQIFQYSNLSDSTPSCHCLQQKTIGSYFCVKRLNKTVDYQTLKNNLYRILVGFSLSLDFLSWGVSVWNKYEIIFWNIYINTYFKWNTFRQNL